MMRRDRGFLAGMTLGAIAATLVGAMLGRPASARQDARSPLNDSPELAALYDEDQADRMPAEGKPIHWVVVGPRDRRREARVKEVYRAGGLRTGKDYRRAAMVLQHASGPDDFLLAHDFCLAALALGDVEARWLAAATEDRYLMNLGRPQRFGTQFRSEGPGRPFQLHAVDPAVTDGLRSALGVPTLAEARAREAEMNRD